MVLELLRLHAVVQNAHEIDAVFEDGLKVFLCQTLAQVPVDRDSLSVANKALLWNVVILWLLQNSLKGVEVGDELLNLSKQARLDRLSVITVRLNHIF